MRIGLVTQSYYPVRGGVTEHVYHLGRELVRRGHEVTVVTGNSRQPDDHDLRVIRGGFQIPLTMNGASVAVTWGWKLGRWLQCLEERERFDLVHIQAPLDPGLPLIASRTMRRPKVGTYHTFRDSHVFADAVFRLFRPVFNDAVRRISRHIAVSNSAKAVCHRYYPDLPIEVIPNGVDTERFSPAVKPFPQFRDGIFTILFVGRMDPRKGSRYLFQALPYLERALPAYRLLVVGSGWRKNVYQRFIPFGLGHRVHFAGFAAWDDLPRYYRSADAYCSPAIGGESFGIVLLEAMASQLPVVASNIQGYRNVLTDGQEGLFIPPRDPRTLASAIIRLARQPKLRADLAAAGRTTARRYDWRAVTDAIEAVYRSVA